MEDENQAFTTLSGIRDSGTGEVCYTLHDLEPDSRYIVQVQAKNRCPATQGNNKSNWTSITGKTMREYMFWRK